MRTAGELIVKAALMNKPDVEKDLPALVPKDLPVVDRTPARLNLKFLFFRPGAYASSVECPIFFAICKKDSVAPPDTTLSYAKMAPKGVIKEYDASHFEIYVGEPFKQAIHDYKAFLQEHFPIKP